MKKTPLLHIVRSLAACALTVLLTSSLMGQTSKPNFLIIIADDMGYSDAGCYGSEISTPNLDALAAGGLRFTQFYNTARCWPTRAALLSGYYPQQVHRDSMPGVNTKQFGGGGVRPAWGRLVSERLQAAGYRTYHSGKWHVDGKPTENGFDLSNEIGGGAGFFAPAAQRKKNPDDKFYRTVATADHAIECLREHAEKYADRPFFHYLAFHAPHFPLHALPEDIEIYRERYLGGWDKLRDERFAKQKQLGLTTTELSALEPDIGPPYDFPEQIALLGPGEINKPIPWQELSQAQQLFQANKMAIHAAMIHRMDREIGRVLEQLRTMNSLENTLVCFLSDNGASAEIMVRGEGHDPAAPMGSADTYLCLGPGFSSAANTPFRRHKTWVHEGGISTPFIVHWPRGIAARNELRSTVGHVIDIAPTLLDLAGVTITADEKTPLLPGASLKSSFSENTSIHQELWFYHEGNRGLRQGDWKIVLANGSREFPWNSSDAAQRGVSSEEHWSLYDMATDRAEQNDLADREPARLQAMSARWHAMREQFIRDAAVK